MTKEIRFIDPCYNELFRVKNNSMVTVEREGEIRIQRVRAIDDYHLMMGGNTYHICELAEMAERNGLEINPEPTSDAENKAWKFGYSEPKYLAVQSCDDGWDYTLYDEELEVMDGGQLDQPELKIEEARNEILDILERPANILEEVENFEDMLFCRAQTHLIKNAAKDTLSTLVQQTEDSFAIFQLPANHRMCFQDLKFMKVEDDVPKFSEFNGVYVGALARYHHTNTLRMLENLYLGFNVNHPADYTGRSVSVGDVIVLKQGETYEAYMIGSFSFDKMDEFLFDEDALKDGN